VSGASCLHFSVSRSANTSNANNARNVTSTGTNDNNNANNANYVAPDFISIYSYDLMLVAANYKVKTRVDK